jgi:hypothetical protein
MEYRAQYATNMMENAEPKIFYDHKTAVFTPPEIVQVPSKYDRYDKKKAPVIRPKKKRNETCLFTSQEPISKESG